MKKILTKEIFHREIASAGSIVILGHVHPDGDSIGSVLGIYNYIKNFRGDGAAEPLVYLDDPREKFSYLPGFSHVRKEKDPESFDIAIASDCADSERLGRFLPYFSGAKIRLVIDHHVTNPGFGDYCLIDAESSSASELVYSLFDEAYVDSAVAECIYTGIVHDTGVFRYKSTTKNTLFVAGRCMAKGIDFSSIIEDTYFSQTFSQQKVLGCILSHLEKRSDGRFVYSFLDLKTRKKLGGEDVDLDGMIDKIRVTAGALMAVFLYETKDGQVKASLRSNTDDIDVSKMALSYGGGGHARAAGCFMSDDFMRDIDELFILFNEALRTGL